MDEGNALEVTIVETGSDWVRNSGSHRSVEDDLRKDARQAGAGARISVAWIGCVQNSI